jgi:hypothetical protein
MRTFNRIAPHNDVASEELHGEYLSAGLYWLLDGFAVQ